MAQCQHFEEKYQNFFSLFHGNRLMPLTKEFGGFKDFFFLSEMQYYVLGPYLFSSEPNTILLLLEP